MIVHVICHNSNGEPDICTVEVEASAIQLSNGEHYTTAKEMASAKGYDVTSSVCVDQQDWIFKMITPQPHE